MKKQKVIHNNREYKKDVLKLFTTDWEACFACGFQKCTNNSGRRICVVRYQHYLRKIRN